MRSFIYFLWAAVRNPMQVSTLFATGPTAVGSLVSEVPSGPEVRVVELGVGTGAITQALLTKVHHQENYVGIELNPDMIVFARERFPQLRFECDSAENFAKYLGDNKVDAVVSSLPWTLMPPDVVKKTLDQISQNLKPEGVFATYLTLHVLKTPAGRRLQSELSERFDLLETRVVFENLPPVKVLVARHA